MNGQEITKELIGQMQPTISIIIPTINEEEGIVLTLSELLQKLFEGTSDLGCELLSKAS